MTRIRLRYVQAFVDRKTGATFHYFHRAGFPLVRLSGLPGSEQFMAAYSQALGSAPEPVGASRRERGSVAAAIGSYYGCPEFKALAASCAARTT